jgi:DNA-binding NtrC family response regulator
MYKNIVIVDDDRSIRTSIEKIMTCKGYNNPCDLILLDFNNGSGMDGEGFMLSLKNGSIPVYLISGEDSPRIHEMINEYEQVKGNFLKPFSLKKIIELCQIGDGNNTEISDESILNAA